MNGKANLNVRIFGTFEDRDGNVQEIDHTFENEDGLFLCCVKYPKDELCQQDVATIGRIASYSWPKFIDAMCHEISGDMSAIEAIKDAMAEIAEKESIQVDTESIQKH